MADFDINLELEVIKVIDYLFKTSIIFNSLCIDFEYFYYGHRLGTRVPIFVIISEYSDWNEEAIVYFCKIGNVLSIKNELIFKECDILSHFLSSLLRRYGSNHGIFIYYGDENKNSVFRTILSSPFLVSEINCIINVSRVDEYNKSSKKLQEGILYITVNNAKDSDLLNALILERLQREMKLPCLDWNWQYEQSDKMFLFSNLVFKNIEKWKNTESRGSTVEGTKLIPMKLMRDEDKDHSPNHVLELYPNLGLIIDLSNDEGSYEKGKFLEKGIEYERIQIESKIIPSSIDVYQFIKIVKDFTASENEKDIIVHCHYGYNRTGLMICAYLIEEKNLNVQEALKRFKEARPPGIKHQNYIDKLILRYSEYKKL